MKDKLPKYIQKQIVVLAKNSLIVKQQNDNLLYWFKERGLLNDDLDGIINDLLIDMTSQNFEPIGTINLIEQVINEKSL